MIDIMRRYNNIISIIYVGTFTLLLIENYPAAASNKIIKK